MVEEFRGTKIKNVRKTVQNEFKDQASEREKLLMA